MQNANMNENFSAPPSAPAGVVNTTSLVSMLATMGIMDVVRLMGLAMVMGMVAMISVGVYRVWFSPLAKIPGPKLWAATRLPMIYYLFSANLPFKILELHEKYGPVVRLAPNEISFTDEDAWAAIYGKLETAGKDESSGKVRKQQMMKDPLQFKNPYSTAPNGLLFETDDAIHGRLRRNFSAAFSERAMRDQEPTILKYINTFIIKLHEKGEEGKVPLDMCKWYNFVAFDHIGDLVFGKSFFCLERDELHAWITMLFDWAAGLALMGVTMRFGPLYHLLYYLVPKQLRDADTKHRELTAVKLEERLAVKDEDRKDFLSHVLRTLDTPSGITKSELLETCRVLVTGGSETTATLLSGVTYYLCANPSALAQLTAEVRGTFKSADEINMVGVSKLEYLLAVLNEGLRMFPPIPGNMRRYTPEEGKWIAGTWVPGGTLVAVDQYASNHLPANFHESSSFSPSRWLPTPPPQYLSDKRKVVQPFSVGPRNCIGKTLAYMEMRLLLARVVWEFDLVLDDEEEKKGMGSWRERCDVLGFWRKPALWVRLVPREGVEGEEK